jgi:hypothetical protein
MRIVSNGKKFRLIELTVTFTVSLQVLIPLLTVAIYEVVVVGATMIEGVVAPVDQRMEEFWLLEKINFVIAIDPTQNP